MPHTGRPDRLTGIEQKLDLVLKYQEQFMGQLEDFAVELDNETNAISARIDTLLAELQTAKTTGQAPLPSTLAALSAVSARLKTLGQDPSEPIPPPAPDPTPPAIGHAIIPF